ncbi:alpha-1,3-mannosyl-glycoprotein 4-beta-N-acetylglucosaminyltransferase B-like isoform X2 [Myzus persicae]|nr:alpha-1,3-mannosyl-glycoprotein 4-beta-N-acetylglucosaminyltransferase B-like isoform X2 [Myzus persicae]XP_022183742.1 alpha-1,3-mannosyl-glycoprotein 4-beta-N-acetylglucosaminyltransferase B-like isoform X2 [Myzus persicae]XP_022183744.1 alpha-1,3-mannosyl-glycoprotein 4-beta-N-acetylglucosaminyltransferase B-like isoform X2 [Myzus persicae]
MQMSVSHSTNYVQATPAIGVPMRWNFQQPRSCFWLFIIMTCVSCFMVMCISILGTRYSYDHSPGTTFSMKEMEMLIESLTRLNELNDKDTKKEIKLFGPILEEIVKSMNVSISKQLQSLTAANKLVELVRSPMTHLDKFTFLPQLWSHEEFLRPVILHSGGRKAVSVVYGMPTVRRSKENYLIPTLINIVSNMNQTEREDSLIVVMIGETDHEYTQQVTAEIKNRLPEAVNSGLVDIICPTTEYYPDFSKLRKTLGDHMNRVSWRSKQNLDYAFLMMYCQPKGSFYVQMEDDIIAKPQFHTIMKNTALQMIADGQEWFLLDFGELGFIGKIIRCSDLPWVIQYFIMFYNDQPGDWLLDGIVEAKACGIDKINCRQLKDNLWVKSNQTVFQHIGNWSSLAGKIQRMKAKNF